MRKYKSVRVEKFSNCQLSSGGASSGLVAGPPALMMPRERDTQLLAKAFDFNSRTRDDSGGLAGSTGVILLMLLAQGASALTSRSSSFGSETH